MLKTNEISGSAAPDARPESSFPIDGGDTMYIFSHFFRKVVLFTIIYVNIRRTIVTRPFRTEKVLWLVDTPSKGVYELLFIIKILKHNCLRKGEMDMSEAISEQETQNVSVGKEQNDVLDQLLKPEVQESLTILVDQLPKLTELVNLLTKSYDFAQTVATDKVLKSDTVGAITEIVEPVKHSVKNIAATVIEAKDRAEDSNEVIGLFGLLKMLKDPQAQKIFRFLNAYLQISAEKAKQQ